MTIRTSTLLYLYQYQLPTCPAAGQATQHAEVVTIRAMGQTFHVKNHMLQPASPALPTTTAIVATTTTTTTDTTAEPLDTAIALSHQTSFPTVNDDQSLSVCEEDLSPPLSSPSMGSSPLSACNSGSAVTSCADQSDYKDFLSKFGILNLPLHPSLERHSVTQIDSPDDTLISQYSPLVDQIDPLLTTANGGSGKSDLLLLLCRSGLTLSPTSCVCVMHAYSTFLPLCPFISGLLPKSILKMLSSH